MSRRVQTHLLNNFYIVFQTKWILRKCEWKVEQVKNLNEIYFEENANEIDKQNERFNL